jgi:Ion channel
MLVLGTLGFVLIEGYSSFDAFYMALITISTVGYQELKPLSHALAKRLYNRARIYVHLVGAGLDASATRSSSATRTFDVIAIQGVEYVGPSKDDAFYGTIIEGLQAIAARRWSGRH